MKEKESAHRYLEDAVHALQGPLTTVRTLVELGLSRASDPGEVERLLRESLKEVEAMSSLVSNLLFLAQADSGALALDLRPVDLSALAGECVGRLRAVADAKRIQLSLAAHGSVPACVDPAQIRQLLGILLDNALKYTPEGGRIAVEVASEGGSTRLTVSDTGAGIPPEAQPRIFDRFFQVDKDESRRRGSVGVGLSIARAIAQAHGAQLTVESEPGKGTEFTLRLQQHAPQGSG